MPELQTKDVYIVDGSNEAARSLMMKLCEEVQSGAVIFVTNAEFECLNKSVIRIKHSE